MKRFNFDNYEEDIFDADEICLNDILNDSLDNDIILEDEDYLERKRKYDSIDEEGNNNDDNLNDYINNDFVGNENSYKFQSLYENMKNNWKEITEDLKKENNNNRNNFDYLISEDTLKWEKVKFTHNFEDDNFIQSPEDYFNLFFTQELKDLIVEQTNLYACQFIQDNSAYLKKYKSSLIHRWKMFTHEELETYIGIQILMTIAILPELDDYWSTNSLLHSEIANLMGRNRFILISKFIHLNDNKGENAKKDKLYKVRPLIEHLNTKFPIYAIPGNFITIDEQMVGFKGRLAFKQYIPSKPTKYGVKVFECCCSTTSYCFGFEVYSGRSDKKEDEGLPVANKVVYNLVKNYLNENRIIFMDNFFTNPDLLLDFLKMNTGIVGTLRKNRLKNKSVYLNQVKNNEIRVYDNDKLRVIQFEDTREVFMISTLHNFNHNSFQYNIKNEKINFNFKTIKNNENKQNVFNSKIDPSNDINSLLENEKSNVQNSYNRYARGVDVCNMMLKNFEYPHKVYKWWKCLFFYCINIMLHNSYVLYKHHSNKNKLNNKSFRMKIVEYLLKPIIVKKEQNKKMKNVHYSQYIDKIKKSNKRLSCKVCLKRTSYQCSNCIINNKHVSLCIDECFENYHKNS